MAKKAATTRKPLKTTLASETATSSKTLQAPNGESNLPLARHISITGTESLLLVFTALFLPRSTSSLLGDDWLPPPSSSLDRPQHPWLEPLTASPTLTLLWLSAGVALVISWSAGYARAWAKGKRTEESDQTQATGNTLIATRPVALRDSWLSTLSGVPIIYLLLVLFGAPLTSHCTQTALLSLLLSLLVIHTPIYSLGLPSLSSDSTAYADRLTFVRLFSEFSVRTHLERALVYPVIGSVVGCWIGAFVLPLDWDRPWQAWPLIPAYMAVFGHVVGALVSVTSSSILSLASLDKVAE